jgi:hypothetical protein
MVAVRRTAAVGGRVLMERRTAVRGCRVRVRVNGVMRGWVRVRVLVVMTTGHWLGSACSIGGNSGRVSGSSVYSARVALTVCAAHSRQTWFRSKSRNLDNNTNSMVR